MYFIDVSIQVTLSGELQVTPFTGKVPIEKMNCFYVDGKGIFPGKITRAHFTLMILFLFMNSFDVLFEL